MVGAANKARVRHRSAPLLGDPDGRIIAPRAAWRSGPPRPASASLAQQMSGSIAPNPAQVPKPQSVPAITRSGPTMSVNLRILCGDQLGMLDVVGRRVEHARGEDLVLGDRRLAPHRPFVGVARVGRLEQNRRRLGAQDHVDDLLERDVEVVRALVVAPAQVHAHAVGGNVAQRVVDRLHVALDAGHEFLVGAVAVHDVPAHGQVGRVDLQQHAGGHDRLVLHLHRLADRLQVLLQRAVVLVGLKQRDDPGRGRVHERAGDRLAFDRRLQPREVALAAARDARR